MSRLRDYQAKLKHDIYQAWHSGHKVPFAISPCGSGKTVLFSDILREHRGAGCAIAHRNKLVSQISLSLAREGVQHRIIGSSKAIQAARKLHLRKLGRNYIDPNALIGVAGVSTLAGKGPTSPEWTWLQQVTKWVGDEGHHFLKANEWGKAVKLFTNATCIGLLVSATPRRADGNGLGVETDGLADVIIEGPSFRELIHRGFLLDYRIFTVPTDIDYSVVPTGPSGELVHAKLREAVHKSKTFVGNIVTHYQRIAPGELAIAFAVDIESGSEIVTAFKKAGIACEIVHGDTPEDLRNDIFDQFEQREITVMVSVDLLGEGVDFPAAEVVILGRRTESFALFVQQTLRAGRPLIDDATMKVWDSFTDDQRKVYLATSKKPYFKIIDHVGNVLRHAVMRIDPHSGELTMDLCHAQWSLDRSRGKGSSTSDAIPFRFCSNLPCSKPFEKFRLACPYCDTAISPPATRATPEVVEGDLCELDAAVLQQMYDKITATRLETTASTYGMPTAIQRSVAAGATEKRYALEALTKALAWYGGYLTARGIVVQREQWREFFLTFGTDIASIQTGTAREMLEWCGKISEFLARKNIDATVSLGLDSVQFI